MNRNLLLALSGMLLVGVGMFAGFRLKENIPFETREEMSGGLDKIQEAFWFAQRNYVKDPDTKKMVDDAIAGMLEGLDPHSFYIPAQEMEVMEEQMNGSFEGIGVEFNLLEDTIYVVSPISGGPSEQLGIQAGDRIVKINGENVAGVGITNNDVMKHLRGPKGSKVNVEVARRGVNRLIKYEITRDKIPLYSVDYSYMIRPKTGYVKVSRFASTTYDEFHQAVLKLKQQNMESLVLDLRGNPGGYMEMAQRIADDFLSDGKLVVYTEGRIYESKSRYKATSYINAFEKGPLVVLMDYGSASASEIVAGAIQDHDRGLIVGVRSFGKGLVQTQKEFEDGSAMRLVISKYYTPSGRCIQKPYDKSAEEYENEIVERFNSGEIYDPQKMMETMPDSLKFKTAGGRTVYGGGGIYPDVFAARDTSMDSDYLTLLIAGGVFNQFAFHYADKHPEIKQKYKNAQDFNKNFRMDDALLRELTDFATTQKIDFVEKEFQVSRTLIAAYAKAFIARRYYNDDGFYPAMHEVDNVLLRAIELLPVAADLERTGKLNMK